MTFPELIKDIFDSSKERMKNPISGAYALSFILWNWRPILYLTFENEKILKKIEVVNKDYCNWGSLFYPLLISLIFTIGIPFIMTFIDWIIKWPKKTRIKNIYDAKIDDTTGQIELAKKELELQDIRTRNKEKQDFQDKILSLESEIEQTKSSNNKIIERYQSQISELQKSIELRSTFDPIILSDTITESEKSMFTDLTRSHLNQEQLVSIKKLPSNTHTMISKQKLSTYVYSFLLNQRFIEDHDDFLHFTSLGLRYKLFLERHYLS